MAANAYMYPSSLDARAIAVARASALMEVVDEHFLELPQPETADDIRHIEMLGMYRALLMSVR